MKAFAMKMSVALQGLMLRDEGQDLIEYALLAALLALAATATLKTLASDINSAFLAVDTNLQGAL